MAPSSSSKSTSDNKPPRELTAEKSTIAPAPTEGDLPESDDSNNTQNPPSSSGGPYGSTMKDGRTLKGMMKDKIEQASKGKGENPTLLGDPTSLKAETTERDPVDHDNGPGDGQGSKRKDSKL